MIRACTLLPASWKGEMGVKFPSPNKNLRKTGRLRSIDLRNYSR